MTWPEAAGSDSGFGYLLDNFPRAVSFLDTQGYYVEANTNACALTGLTRDQLLGSCYLEHVVEADRSRVDHAFQKALQRNPVTAQHRVSRQSGETVDVATTFLPFISQDQVVGLYCLDEDISEHVADQRALVDSERRYRALFDQNPNLIFSTDIEGRITDANAAAEAISGVSRADLLGVSVFDFAAESELDTLTTNFDKLKAGFSTRYEISFTQADGSPGELAITALPIFKNDVVVGTHSIATDITKQRRYERQLTERVKELNCLREITEILEKSDNLRTPVLKKISQSLQAGFQYPDTTAVRIVLGDAETSTENFRKTDWLLSETITSGKQTIGAVEVAYLESRPEAAEGPFLTEERHLLQDIAGKLKRIYNRYKLSKELHLAANALNSTAEGIMVLDRQAQVVMVNPAFLRLSGYRENELLHKVLREAPGDPPMLVQDWFSVVEARGPLLSGENWYERKDGSRIPVLASISAIEDNSGITTHYVVTFRDLSEQKHIRERLDYLALHDALTDLPNRTLLSEIGAECISQARGKGHYIAVGVLDLDRFKHVNDSMGHDVGNELLIKAGGRLLSHLKGSDSVARLGGDEFALVLPDRVGVDDIRAAAAQIIDIFKRPFELVGQEVAVTASLGIAVFPADGNDFESLLRNAERAMYSAKEHGRISYQLYSKDMEQGRAGSRALLLRTAMHRALEQEEFRLHFQPIVNLANGRITGMEALIRWHNEELGVVPPSEFIPLAEETGLIYSIGEWVLREAIRQTAVLVRAGHDQLRVAVNLSARQFQEANLVPQIQQYLDDEGLAPHHLELEITETLMMHSIEHTTTTLKKIHALGVSIALDDFGTGYSSLQYLKDFPIEYLKIDKSFVDGLPLGTRDTAITMAIVNMAKALGIHVIAEGVELDEQLAFLRDIGCEEAQGYYLCMPLQGKDLHWLLENHTTLPIAKPDTENRK